MYVQAAMTCFSSSGYRFTPGLPVLLAWFPSRSRYPGSAYGTSPYGLAAAFTDATCASGFAGTGVSEISSSFTSCSMRIGRPCTVLYDDLTGRYPIDTPDKCPSRASWRARCASGVPENAASNQTPSGTDLSSFTDPISRDRDSPCQSSSGIFARAVL